MNDTITLTIDLHKTEILNANHRHHWHEKARRTATIRNKAMTARLQNRAPRLDRAHCLALLEFTDRRTRDANNYADTIKPAIDGIVSGPPHTPHWPHRLLPDDDSNHLIGPDIRIGHNPALRPGWTRLTLTFHKIPATQEARALVDAELARARAAHPQPQEET